MGIKALPFPGIWPIFLLVIWLLPLIRLVVVLGLLMVLVTEVWKVSVRCMEDPPGLDNGVLCLGGYMLR